MISSAQLASCLQLPASLDPVLNISQDTTPASTMWLSAQQQPLDFGMWGLQQAGLDPASEQLQALQGGFLDLSSLSVLQDDSLISLPTVPQGVSTCMNGLSGVLQMQSMQQLPASLGAGLQPLQQVYLTASGEQVVLLDGNQGLAPQQILTCSNGSAAVGANGQLHLQLQQLQEAVQRLTCETAAVQRVLLNAAVSQPLGTQAQPAMLSTEPVMMPTSPPGATDADTSGMTAPLASSLVSSGSPPGSFSGLDSSSSSSWQCVDTVSASNHSSPCYRLQNRSRLGSGCLAMPATSTVSPAQDAGFLRIVSAPEMPQPNPSALTAPHIMAQGINSMGQGIAGVAPASGLIVLGNNGWPAGSPLNQGLMQVPPGNGQPFFAGASLLGQHGTMLPGLDYQASCLAPQQSVRFNPGGNSSQPGPHRFKGSSTLARKGRPANSAPSRSAEPASAGGAAAQPSCGAGEAAAAGKPEAAVVKGPSCLAHVPLEQGLKQLWSGEQLQRSKGGSLFNVQQLAWHPAGEPDPTSQDMYNFQKLKRMVQKLDAVHKTRVKLIKRIHAVADHGESDLKAVYREVRCLIGEMLHDSAMQIKSMDECRVTGLVRLALMLQEALELGPKETSAPALGPV